MPHSAPLNVSITSSRIPHSSEASTPEACKQHHPSPAFQDVQVLAYQSTAACALFQGCTRGLPGLQQNCNQQHARYYR
jgi:hypothetical protein